jgi:hypothetical protein
MGAQVGYGDRDDLATLAVALLVVPLTWWLFLGWSWPLGIFGYDDLTLPGLLAIREMGAGGGGWAALVYRADLLGGAKVANVNGAFPLYPLGVALGLPAVGVSVLSGFIVQALLGFLGCRAATDLTAAWSGGGRRLTLLERVATVWLVAFTPALGWRFGVGHPALVIGLLPFAAALALLIAAAARTPTATLVAVSTAAVALGVLHVGHQLLVYGAVFGAPILLGAWISLGAPWRRLALPALVVIGAVLLALPSFWGILAQARSSDSPRALGGTSVTYGFVTATATDWVASLPWMRTAPQAGFRAQFAHEVNYPAGPLLLLLALVPWRRARALGMGLAISLVAILVFSMDVAPVSRALLAAIPPLGSFRVPARSALLWLLLVPILATPGLAHRDATAAHRAVWLVLPAAATLLLLPTLGREAAAALLVVGVTILAFRGAPRVPAAIVLVVLGISSVAAFRERLSPLLSPQSLFATAEGIGTAVRAAKPGLGSALTRAQLDFEVPPFATNTAFAAGLSSLDGYAVPTRRFSALVSALRGERYEPTANFFRLTAADPAQPALRQLYNVTDRVTLEPPRRLGIRPLGPTAGPAWFSASVARAEDDLAALARQLRESGELLHARAREVLWRDGADPLAASAAVPPALDDRCRDARVAAVRAPRHGREIVAEVATAAACPLTFATNFTEELRATAVREDGRRVAVHVFPGYGALASMVVPPGTTAIHLHAEPVRLPWAAGWVVLGLACCAGAAWLTRRSPVPQAPLLRQPGPEASLPIQR